MFGWQRWAQRLEHHIAIEPSKLRIQKPHVSSNICRGKTKETQMDNKAYLTSLFAYCMVKRKYNKWQIYIVLKFSFQKQSQNKIQHHHSS